MSSVAIVTGASQGIGRATAILLACDFRSLVLAARNPGCAQSGGGRCEHSGSGAAGLRSRLEQSLSSRNAR